jgi:hypothetical protein
MDQVDPEQSLVNGSLRAALRGLRHQFMADWRDRFFGD